MTPKGMLSENDIAALKYSRKVWETILPRIKEQQKETRIKDISKVRRFVRDIAFASFVNGCTHMAFDLASFSIKNMADDTKKLIDTIEGKEIAEIVQHDDSFQKFMRDQARNYSNTAADVDIESAYYAGAMAAYDVFKVAIADEAEDAEGCD